MYILLALNGYLIWQYQQNPVAINTIIPLYWVQSVLIGLFTFIDLLTMRTIIKTSFTFNNKTEQKSGCLAFFFLVHYGFFHLGYLLFMLFTGVDIGKIDWSLLKMMTLVLFVNQFYGFVQHKMRLSKMEVNPTQIMMLPYLRIIPMHLTILIPSFIHISSFLFFLVLKTICDVAFYIISNRLRYKPAISE